MTNKEIFQLVYRQTMFAIKEGKSEKDIAFFIYNISKTTNKNFLDVTSVLLNNKKIESYDQKIDYKVLGQMQQVIYQIRKDYRKGILDFTKEIAENLDENSNIKEKSLVDLSQFYLKKQEAFSYFQLLLQALSLKMPIEMSLEVVALKSNTSSKDIYKKGVDYFLNFATSKERNIYINNLNRYRKNAATSSLDYRVNTLIYQIFQVFKDEDSKEQSLMALLENVDIIFLNRLKQRIDNTFKFYLPEIKKLLGNEEAFSANLIINKVLNKFINLKKVKSAANFYPNPVVQGQALAIIEAFLKFNGTVKEFANSDIYPYKYHSAKITTNRLLDLCNQHKPELLQSLRTHLNDIKEYELSYANTLIDIVIYYRRNGYPTADGKTRPFDILDYYSYTNYPLDKLRSYVVKNNLLCPDDVKVLSSFSGNNVMGKTYQNYEFTLEKLENSYNVSFRDDDTLTKEEKIGIYDFLSHYNIPIIPATINTAIRRYKKGTLFITKCEEDKQANSEEAKLKKELVPKA